MNNIDYNDALSKCVKCGSCKAFCTTYDKSPNEGMTARGRLSLLYAHEKKYQPVSKLLNERIFSCILCGKCINNCPLSIDIREVIYHARANLHKSDKVRRFLRFMIKLHMKNPDLTYNIYRLIHNNIYTEPIKKIFNPLNIKLPPKTFHETFNVITPQRKIGRVVIFSGCVINYIYPNIGESLINLLFEIGYEIIVPKGEVCCGTPLRTLGLENEAIELAKKNISLFNKLNAEAIISLCPSCTLTIKQDYPKLIGESIVNIVDVSCFLLKKLNYQTHKTKKIKAIYHEPCHMKYGLGIDEEPKELIKKTGIKLIELKEQKCCGFAGLFSFSFKELSDNILDECLKEYTVIPHDLIITTCPGCIIQLSKKIKDKPILHLVELLDQESSIP